LESAALREHIERSEKQKGHYEFKLFHCVDFEAMITAVEVICLLENQFFIETNDLAL
jgi:hypothetical protein